MRNADGRSHNLTDLLTAERMKAAKREEARSRRLARACKRMGDTGNYIQAALDWAAARNVARVLRGEGRA